MYVVRAFEVLFTWLQVDIFGGEAANRWGSFKKITVCGHSMGGSVSLLFAYLLKQTDNRLRALKPGQRMHVIGLSEFLDDPYLRCTSPRYAAVVCSPPVVQQRRLRNSCVQEYPLVTPTNHMSGDETAAPPRRCQMGVSPCDPQRLRPLVQGIPCSRPGTARRLFF